MVKITETLKTLCFSRKHFPFVGIESTTSDADLRRRLLLASRYNVFSVVNCLYNKIMNISLSCHIDFLIQSKVAKVNIPNQAR